MKKLFIGLAMVIAAATAHAEYLYWQVGDFASSAIDTSGEHEYSFTFWQTDQDGNTSQRDTYVYNPVSGQYESLTTVDSYTAQNTQMYADVNADSVGTQYSYYVEITGYNTSTGQQWINRSESVTYAAASANMTTDLGSVSSIPTAWSGGSYSAPEPTGGLLVLIGGALLALRRRRV